MKNYFFTLAICGILFSSCGALKQGFTKGNASSFTPSNSSDNIQEFSSENTTSNNKTTLLNTKKVKKNLDTNLTNIDLKAIDLNAVVLDKDIIDDNSLQLFAGALILENNQVVFKPSDCQYKNSGVLLKGLKKKNFKEKKWLKKIKSNKNKKLNYISIKGIKAPDSPVIFVKKISKPLKKVKVWSSGQPALYLQTAQELYKRTIELREKYNLFSVNITEVDDPNLGKITEYTLYDSKCNRLSPEEIKKMSDKELNGLNNSLKIGGGLLLKQAALTGLAALSTSQIASAGYLDKVLMGKDAITAGVFQTAIVAQLPKIMKNLKASKKYIDQLKAE